MGGLVEFPKLLGNLVVFVAETVAILCVVALRFPVRVAAVAVFVVFAALASLHAAVGVVFYSAIVLALWNVAGRVLAKTTGDPRVTAAYQWLVGRRLYSAWRRWWLFGRRWQATLASQHLTRVKANAYDEVPKLCKVRSTPFGDTLLIKPLHGDTVRDYIGMDGQVAQALAKAFRARECRVYDMPQTDYLRLELPRGKDPLVDTIPFPGIPASAADVDLRRIPIGLDDRGRVVTIPLLGAHVLVIGMPGAGKGSIFWAIIMYLLPLVREGSVRLWALDPKRGVEMNPGRNLFHAFADTEDDIQTMLARAVSEMDANNDWIKERKLRKLMPTPERPLNVIFVDELGRLAGDKQCEQSVRTLVSVGRAAGFPVVGAAQNGTKEIVRDRDEFPVKVGLHIDNSDTVRKLFGRAAYAAGARCEEIPLSMPGTGYVKVDRKADELEDRKPVPRWLSWLPSVRREKHAVTTALEPTRFRAFYVDDELIARVNEEFAPQPEPAEAGPPKLHVVPDLAEAPASGSS